MKLTLFNCVCAISLLLITPVYTAPRRRYKDRDHSSTKFDQKQSGDYNVQVHLKDFHIIALLGDDSWGSLGDYDYNYDYSDLTIKPIISITSEQPPESSSVSEASSDSDVQKPLTSHTALSSTTDVSTSTIKSVSIDTTENHLITTESNQKPLLSSTSVKPVEQTTKSEYVPITNVSLIPVKIISDVQNDNPLPLGEILHYRKCTDGYSKDAHGRCRKIVRKNSQIPFGISRFASSIASKIRQATSTKTSFQ